MIRRDFLKSAAIATGGLLFPVHLHAKEKKISLAVIGTGWWACDFLIPAAIASGGFEIKSICDVDKRALKKAESVISKAGGKPPALFTDYKEMFRESGLEAVVISTPTHWHALQFIDACKQGLHVFLEKPVSYDMAEADAMQKAKDKAGIRVQVDFPRVMVPTYHQVKQYIQSGEAGTILQAEAHINHPEAPIFEKPVPDSVDFDTYCGPAPLTKYLCFEDKDVMNWRGVHSFSRGIMADWGIHYLHNVRTILNLGIPDRIHATGGTVKNFSHDNPDHLTVQYDFGKLPVRWSHKSWGYISPDPGHDIGVTYYGEKATVFANDSSWEVYTPGGKRIPGESIFPTTESEETEWYQDSFEALFIEFYQAIIGKTDQGISNTFEEAVKTTSTVILGDIAYRVDSALEFDAAKRVVENNDSAQARFIRPYREPYIHP